MSVICGGSRNLIIPLILDSWVVSITVPFCEISIVPDSAILTATFRVISMYSRQLGYFKIKRGISDGQQDLLQPLVVTRVIIAFSISISRFSLFEDIFLFITMVGNSSIIGFRTSSS